MSNTINQYIDKGTSVTLNINVVISNSSVDLTAYTANASFRRHYGSANSVTFTCNGYANGLLVLTLSANQTSNIEAGKYVYDATITNISTNAITRVVEGILNIKDKVT